MSKPIDFEDQIGFRIKRWDRSKIKAIIKKNQDLYYNESHFIRSAVLQLIRRHGK